MASIARNQQMVRYLGWSKSRNCFRIVQPADIWYSWFFQKRRRCGFSRSSCMKVWVESHEQWLVNQPLTGLMISSGIVLPFIYWGLQSCNQPVKWNDKKNTAHMIPAQESLSNEPFDSKINISTQAYRSIHHFTMCNFIEILTYTLTCL